MAEKDMDMPHSRAGFFLIGLFLSLWLVTETPIENKLTRNEYFLLLSFQKQVILVQDFNKNLIVWNEYLNKNTRVDIVLLCYATISIQNLTSCQF